MTTQQSLTAAWRPIRVLPRLRIDGFAFSLVLVVLAATFLPCQGMAAKFLHLLGIAAIGSLFFLQGARLSREAVWAGITHWRLHGIVASTTFVIFPLTGLALTLAIPAALPPILWLGVLFLCALPSTVQSSIALVSISKGNVAGAVCTATASNIAGMVVTPFLFSALANVESSTERSVIDLSGFWQVLVELLAPFIVGHLLRPYIGRWADRNRSLLAITDRSSILLVVYTAFSAAVTHGVWTLMPPNILAPLLAVVAAIFVLVLAILVAWSRAAGFGRPDKIAAILCGTQKSLVSGVPIANAMFSSAVVGPLLLPMMVYYLIQLLAGAWLARHYAKNGEPTSTPLRLSAGKG
jgi:solute carrier family 10 (sodium/bile acid cotransporter), member 7